MTTHKYKVALKGNNDITTYKGRVDVYATNTFEAADKVRAMIADGGITIDVDMQIGVERIEVGDCVGTYSVPVRAVDTAFYEGRIEVQADCPTDAYVQVERMIRNDEINIFDLSMSESEQITTIDAEENIELVKEDAFANF